MLMTCAAQVRVIVRVIDRVCQCIENVLVCAVADKNENDLRVLGHGTSPLEIKVRFDLIIAAEYDPGTAARY